jgi:hypothetical protein
VAPVGFNLVWGLGSGEKGAKATTNKDTPASLFISIVV